MARPPSEHPTDLELRILKILWEQSPLPVREVRARLAEQGHQAAHTSVITTLNIMVRKGYLTRRRQGKAYEYRPRVDQEGVTRRMVEDMRERVFNGSARAMLVSLFQSSDLDAEEIRELRQLINRKAREQSS